ncbi:hypothetical protein SAMN04487891_10227 [Flagellimonas taeanensis]|uniref:Uncharacterized protein n=1 Tax=Flagellimonas taeanensis TaxID=1005926 RepID=A0A1M6RC54_9FLAO|nr:hypothetical protein [Allomuricauda taeanensis]SFB74782.1 hypothetical protein SAMN04487891_10227 [Allomuricauda taeanensis]SHK29980.1 hypothetical protein SAMN05216293_0702 [Allomuricauda taeanensis]
MKNSILITSMIWLLAMTQIQAQNGPTGVLNSTTTNTFNYVKEGVKMPYFVTVQESRNYKNIFDIADMGKVDKDRINTTFKVSKLITVTNNANPRDNSVIALRYDKRVADTFKLVSTDRGFAISVDNRTVEYIMGKGIRFANTADRDFFMIDEFDSME